MAINFPTSLDDFANPAPTDSLNTPSHSLQHTDLNDAVEAMQRKVGVGASPAGSATAGQVLTAQGGGTALWATPDYAGSWTSYTPTWTNLTVGNGTNNFAYKEIGKSIFVRGEFSFGSTSSITGGVSFTLPVTSIAYSGEFSFGSVSLGDSGTADYFGAIYYAVTSKGVIRIINAAGTYATFAGISSTVPFTWTTGDSIKFHLFYEAA